jgi:hypothetical protein
MRAVDAQLSGGSGSQSAILLIKEDWWEYEREASCNLTERTFLESPQGSRLTLSASTIPIILT